MTGVIDTDTPVNYPQLYAQAMHELEEGEPFHFFPQEMQKLWQQSYTTMRDEYLRLSADMAISKIIGNFPVEK